MKLGPYDILGEIARGGAGTVYRGHSPDGRTVAIKVLTSRASAPDAFLRFERETRLLSSFSEAEGFVPLLDVLATPNGPALVMPFLEGGTLRKRLDAGPLPIAECVRIALDLSHAIGLAHSRGVVHRDLKPENVLFSTVHGLEPRALVADLGIAKHFRHDLLGASQSINLSKSREIRGTAGYMAPEQAQGSKDAGPTVDVFALGAVLYECIAGRPAFEGDTLVEVLQLMERGRAEPLARARPGAPPWLSAIVERCLERDPRDRYVDGGEVAAALEAGPAGYEAARRKPPVVAIALFALAIAAGAGAYALMPEKKTTTVPPPVPQLRPDAAELTSHAEVELAARRYIAAIALATSAIEARPSYAPAYVVRGAASVERYDFRAARRDLDAAFKLGPRSPRALTYRGEALLEARESEAARDDFAAAVALDPRAWRALVGLARTHVVLSDYDAALRAADAAVRAARGPALGTAYEVRSLVRLVRGDLTSADDLALALEIAPELTMRHVSLEGPIPHLITADVNAARAETLVVKHPKAGWAYAFRSATRGDGEYVEAYQDAELAAKLSPGLPAAWALLARGHALIGRLDEALTHADRAVALDGESAETWGVRASARAARREWHMAREDAARALERNAREPLAWLVEARALEAANDLEGARRKLEAYLDVASTGRLASRARQCLDNLGPASAQPEGELIWFEDAPPQGAILLPGRNASWSMDLVKSGILAHRATEESSLAFDGAVVALGVDRGESLFCWTMVDGQSPPRTVLIEWIEVSGARHGASWGSRDFPGAEKFVDAGALPGPGDWSRLEVPAARLGVEGRVLAGMDWKVLGGAAIFDRVGKR